MSEFDLKVSKLNDLLKPLIKGKVKVTIDMPYLTVCVSIENNHTWVYELEYDTIVMNTPREIACKIQMRYRDFLVNHYININHWISVVEK